MSVQKIVLIAASGLMLMGGLVSNTNAQTQSCGPNDSQTCSERKGEFGIALRYRLELVDQDSFAQDAEASTLRARLNYQSAPASGFSFFAEADYIAEVFLDDFNAGAGNTPNRTQYPVVADPDGFDLNQVYVQYQFADSKFRLGRQRIILDNARFVGNVGWRQNEQTYDGFSINHKAGNGLSAFYAYIDNVNRIFGDDVAAGDHDQNTHLFNISKQWEGIGKLTGYYYDIDNDDAAAFSTRTYGVRFVGKKALDALTVNYTVEYARQSDNGNNPADYNANYGRFDLGLGFEPVTVQLGYEVLDGNDRQAGEAFRTPLATLHAFNGWADQFLATPNAGLEDVFFGFKGKLGKVNWNTLWHEYSAQSGSADFGSELDIALSRKLTDHYALLLKAARFNSDSPVFSDTTKVWLQLSASF